MMGAGMGLLVFGVVVLLGVHLLRVVAPALRAALIARLGKPTFMVLYGLVSLVGLCLVVVGFGQARAVTGLLYAPPVFLKHIALLLMLPAFICLAAGCLPAGRIAVKTRAPLVLAIKIWALAHLLANGETASVLLFGAFLAWGVIVRVSLKRRERAGEEVLPVFRSPRFDVMAIALGLLAYALFVLKLHELLIGISPIAMS